MLSTPESAPLALSPRRVLIVDDSSAQRRLLRLALEGWGYHIAEATSGEAALDLCRQGGFELVLSDWVMPGMSGPELCRAFRALPVPEYGYFILLTSKTGREEVTIGLDAGADDFLPKPLDLSELRARMQAGERIVAMQRELHKRNQQLKSTLTELKSLYATLDHDLTAARRLQQTLIPERSRSFRSATIAVRLRPSGHVSGDLIGYFPLGPDRLAFFSIDVSGHGVASAMLAARLAGILSACLSEGNLTSSDLPPVAPPEAITARLNDLMLNSMQIEQYVTWVYGNADLITGAVDLVQAGHPHPLLLTAAGEVRKIGKGGFPVGLIPGAVWERISLRLSPGDRLLLMTDGVTECRNPQGEDLGEDGLIALMQRNKALRGDALLDALEWDVEQFIATGDFKDDVSALLLDWTGDEPHDHL